MSLIYIVYLFIAALIFIFGCVVGTFIERGNWNELIYQGQLPTQEQWQDVQARIARMVNQR